MRRGSVSAIILVAVLLALLSGCTPPLPEGSPEASQAMPGDSFSLIVTQPADNSFSNTERTEVKGRTSPRAVVTVNEVITTADEQGNFTVAVTLQKGLNIIEVIASDEAGNEATVNLTATLVKGG